MENIHHDKVSQSNIFSWSSERLWKVLLEDLFSDFFWWKVKKIRLIWQAYSYCYCIDIIYVKCIIDKSKRTIKCWNLFTYIFHIHIAFGKWYKMSTRRGGPQSTAMPIQSWVLPPIIKIYYCVSAGLLICENPYTLLRRCLFEDIRGILNECVTFEC